MSDLTVVALNRSAGVVLLSDNTTLPVTNWLDEDGDDLPDADGAVAFVAGSEERELWFSGALHNFQGTTLQ